jgi:hypothetical protein
VLETIDRASKEVVGHGFQDETVGTIRGWGEAEAVQVRAEGKVCCV